VDALESISKLNGYSHEVIIINDGSTDPVTKEILEEYKKNGHRIIDQLNQGLSAARNTGISLARGKYILPLDADNTVMSPYIKEAVEIMEADNSIVVVYGDAYYFGDKDEPWKVGEYNLQRLMIANYIDACALIRATALAEVGGYDTNIKNGMEDWEMWLRLSFKSYGFYYLQVQCFGYRVRYHSMMKTTIRNYSLVNEIENHVNAKYPDKMGHYWITESFVQRFKKSPIKILVKLFLKSYWPSRYNDMLKENKIRNGI
jgi:glycosyltransferase involved in cell wall biosynthesis